MHGLVNRALQRFLRETYGDEVWRAVLRGADLDRARVEAMLTTDAAATRRMVGVAAARLGIAPGMVLEDLGTFLVSSPSLPVLRRLLRFSGETFADFWDALEDLPDRARLAVPDLFLPPMTPRDIAPGIAELGIGAGLPGLCHIVTGAVRAMADDYGALVLVDLEEAADDGSGRLVVRLLDSAHAEGRHFALAGTDE